MNIYIYLSYQLCWWFSAGWGVWDMDVNHFGFQPGTIFSECAQKEEEGGRERGREGERTSLCGGRHAPPAAAPAEWSPAQSRRRKEQKKKPQQQQQKKGRGPSVPARWEAALWCRTWLLSHGSRRVNRSLNLARVWLVCPHWCFWSKTKKQLRWDKLELEQECADVFLCLCFRVRIVLQKEVGFQLLHVFKNQRSLQERAEKGEICGRKCLIKGRVRA